MIQILFIATLLFSNCVTENNQLLRLPNEESSHPLIVSGGPGDVNACHDAAIKYCTTKGGNCKACQAWGSWENMFFVAVCNNDPTTCHQNIQNANNVTCFCQQKGGCH